MAPRPSDDQTQLSAPGASFNEHERYIIANIREHGLHAWFFDAADGLPPIAYTVGFWLTLGHPELIMFGLPHEVSGEFIDDAWNRIKQEGALPVAQPVEGISTQPVYFMPMPDPARLDAMRSCSWFYKTDDFPALHLVWPDEEERFPWQEGYARKYMGYQPDFSEIWRKLLDLPEPPPPAPRPSLWDRLTGKG